MMGFLFQIKRFSILKNIYNLRLFVGEIFIIRNPSASHKWESCNYPKSNYVNVIHGPPGHNEGVV